MDWDRSCERVQYLAKTYALCNHLTACSPNFRLFRRMAKSAKTGLKSIYANEANISPKTHALCSHFTACGPNCRLFLRKAKKWTSIDLCEWVQYLAKTYALCSHLTACGPNLRLFRTMPKNVLKSINANVANIWRKRMPCATILRHFSQKGEKWTEIDHANESNI